MHSISDLFINIFHFFTAYYFQETPLSESLKPQAMKNILILGGGYGAVMTAQRIFKGSAGKGQSATFKITIVSPNTHLYWNLAAPVGAVGLYSNDILFRAIEPGFKQYGDKFEFVLGTAETLDPQAKTVTLADGKTLDYDWLILATGSRLKAPLPLKNLGSTEATKEAMNAFVAKIEESKDIIIGGAGPTGIEIAGEIACEFPEKKIHLVSLAPHIFDV
jgi:NADH dehydrogenase FAD-containing subunit